MTVPLRLDTIRRVALVGPAGPVALDDPRHLALLVRLAAAPGRAASTDDLLLAIWPHLSRERARDELTAAAALLARITGRTLVHEHPGSWSLDADVSCDLHGAAPSRAGAFLGGFSLPDTPEWNDWVDAARREIASRPPPRAKRRRLGLLLIPAAAAAAVAIAYVATRSGTVEGFESGDRVILADVVNTTTDSSLGLAVQIAAAVGLQQSTRLDLDSRARLVTSLAATGRRLEAGGLTEDVAIEIARRDRVPWVVTIAVASDRDRITTTTRLVRAKNGETVYRSVQSAAGVLNVVAALDRSVRGLLRRTGESRRSLDSLPPLTFATTADIEALRAYAIGSDAWRRGDYTLAHDYWRRAVTLDTGFAMAMGSLGAWYYLQHDRQDGARYYREALARAGRLTEWERLRIEDGYATARGDLDSALALSRTIAGRYPRAGSFYGLGTALLRAGRCDEALEALQRSRELDPTNPNTHINIATCYKKLDRNEEARTAYLAAGSLDSTVLYRGNINMEFAGALVETGRLADAESTLTRMTRQPSMTDQALGFRGLGYLALWRGQVAMAQDRFRRAAALSRQQRAPNSLLRNLLLLAAAQRAAGHQAEMRRTLRQVDSVNAVLTLVPGFLTLAVEGHAEAPDTRRVRYLLELMRSRADPRNREDSAHVAYVTGTLALMEASPREGLAAFEEAKALGFPAMLALRRALAYEQLDRGDSARTVLRALVAAPSFGSEDQIAWTRALLVVGEVEERLGRFDDADASYRRFLEQWKDADPGLPDLVRVRARLNALLGRADRP